MHLCEIEALPSVKMAAGQPYGRMTASWHGVYSHFRPGAVS